MAHSTSKALFHLLLEQRGYDKKDNLNLIYIVDFSNHEKGKSPIGGSCITFAVPINITNVFSNMLLNVVNCVDGVESKFMRIADREKVIAEIIIGCVYVTVCRYQDLLVYTTRGGNNYIVNLLNGFFKSFEAHTEHGRGNSSNYKAIYKQNINIDLHCYVQSFLKDYFDLTSTGLGGTRTEFLGLKYVVAMQRIISFTHYFRDKVDRLDTLVHIKDMPSCQEIMIKLKSETWYPNWKKLHEDVGTAYRNVTSINTPEKLLKRLNNNIDKQWQDMYMQNQPYLGPFINHLRTDELIFDPNCPMIRRYVFLLEYIAYSQLRTKSNSRNVNEMYQEYNSRDPFEGSFLARCKTVIVDAFTPPIEQNTTFTISPNLTYDTRNGKGKEMLFDLKFVREMLQIQKQSLKPQTLQTLQTLPHEVPFNGHKVLNAYARGYNPNHN